MRLGRTRRPRRTHHVPAHIRTRRPLPAQVPAVAAVVLSRKPLKSSIIPLNSWKVLAVETQRVAAQGGGRGECVQVQYQVTWRVGVGRPWHENKQRGAEGAEAEEDGRSGMGSRKR